MRGSTALLVFGGGFVALALAMRGRPTYQPQFAAEVEARARPLPETDEGADVLLAVINDVGMDRDAIEARRTSPGRLGIDVESVRRGVLGRGFKLSEGQLAMVAVVLRGDAV